MAIEIYLGKPPADIETWISTHAQPAVRMATRVWYGNDESTYTDYDIVGEISCTEHSDSFPSATSQIPNVESAKKIEIGNAVTKIGDYAFTNCSNLTRMTIPFSVKAIVGDAFWGCSSTLVFQDRTLEQVQNIDNGSGSYNFPWGLDPSLITVE